MYPRLIVLDHTFPGMDAPELLQKLKMHPWYCRIPVIAYSTLVTEGKKAELLKLGAEQCLQKGRSLSKIRQLIQTLKDLAEHQKRA